MKAFPWQEWMNTTDPYTMNPLSHGGMDLRDYFAAKAIQTIYVKHCMDASYDIMAEHAYKMADAMMKAREQ